jgi:hypothetical protein
VTPEQLKRDLYEAGWCVVDGPRLVVGGWRAVIRCGTRGVAGIGRDEIAVLGDLLRGVQAEGPVNSREARLRTVERRLLARLAFLRRHGRDEYNALVRLRRRVLSHESRRGR